MRCFIYLSLCSALAALGFFVPPTPAEEKAKDDGFVSLFDGKTLTGWTISAKTGHSRTSKNKSGGKWVIEEVCRQIQRWENVGLPSIQVALNLSAVQFRSSRLFEEIAAILAHADVLPGQIELEITESLLMDDPAAAVELLGRLRQAGFSIAIDDFGTGYSSLSYLKKFPVGVLKIDRSFIKDLAGNMDDRAIAAAVVSMAGSLLLDVVAEGVETIEQLDVLRDMGCDYIQGYYISKPLPPDEFERFMRVSREHGIEVARIPAQTQAPAIQPLEEPAGTAAVADVAPI